MSLDFEKHAQKGTTFINALALELGNKSDHQRAERVLRTVFRILRGHFSLEENFQFLSQLPMALKAVYVDGWMPMKNKKRARTKLGFIIEIQREGGIAGANDFGSELLVKNAVGAVLRTLRQHISEGELEDAFLTLPKSVRHFLEQSIATHVIDPQRETAQKG